MTAEICTRCNRPVLGGTPHVEQRGRCVVRAVVVHAERGCDSGCCGHEVVGYDSDGKEVYREFEFDHPYETDRQTWATSLVDQHLRGVPIDWPNCEVSDACQ